MSYSTINGVKIYVLHIRNGYEEREMHIRSMLAKLQMPFEFILKGDICDLNQNILDAYFTTPLMHGFCARASCSYKHLLAYQQIINNHLDGALILEDDIILHKDFPIIFNKCMDELKEMANTKAIISFEDSRLRFVPRSKRIRGKYLYEGKKDRMAGAYYITYDAAKFIVDYVSTHKFDRPVDLLHALLLQHNMITYYWCQPTIATQGSFTGRFDSSISDKKEYMTWLVWHFKLNYKKLLYDFR
jgi:glycosyl transferase family 25